MSELKKHELAQYCQADQIAECLGVIDEAYVELWNVVVPQYDKLPRGECPGEVVYPISDYWHLLSTATKREVNRVLKEV